MFRKKDDNELSGAMTTASSQAGEGDGQSSRKFPARPMPIPPRPSGSAAFHPDIPNRAASAHDAPPRREEIEPVTTSPARNNTLTVGQSIHLAGEITACDRLIVDGMVDASVNDAFRIEVGATGKFRGRVEVAEADIAGTFEGELVARDQVTVRASGRVQGTIRYGRIVVEAGGVVAGELAPLEAEAATAKGGSPRPSPAESKKAKPAAEEEPTTAEAEPARTAASAQ